MARFDAVFLGQFRAQKGLEDLVVIWRLVQEVLPGARLAVIGDGPGPSAERLKRELGQFRGQTVSYLGAISGPGKYAVLRASRVFLFPSHHESWGLVALEAMAAGLPVVGYDIPSSREAFGDAILRVAAFDVPAFAKAVVRCLTNEETRQAYLRRGLAIANKYDWDEIAKRFAEDVLGENVQHTQAS